MLTIGTLRHLLHDHPDETRVLVTTMMHTHGVLHEVVDWEWAEGHLHLTVILDRRYKHRLDWLEEC